VQFAVALSEYATGVDLADFSLATTGTAVGTVAAISGSGTSYFVTVNNISGNGTLALRLVDDDSIRDLTGNPLGGSGAGNGNLTGASYTIDTLAPAVASITLRSSNPTNAGTVQFGITFSEAVTGVDAADFALALAGTATGTLGTLSGSGTTYTLSVSNVSGAGTLGLNLLDDDSIVDAVGNRLGGPGPGNGNSTGPSYTIDPLAGPNLMYWVKPVSGGAGAGTAPIAAVAGDYVGGGVAGTASGNPYTVVLGSTAAAAQTVNFELYASVRGTTGTASQQGAMKGALDVLNRPGSAALAGAPGPVSLVSTLRVTPYTGGRQNGDQDGGGGIDVGGPLSGTVNPGANDPYVLFNSGTNAAVTGTANNTNGFTDLLLGTFSFTLSANAADGQSTQIWAQPYWYRSTPWRPHMWLQDATGPTDTGHRYSDTGLNVRYGPAVTLIVAPLMVSVGNVALAEGAAGTTAFAFPVSLSRPSDQPVQVTLDTADGTATAADNDYQPVHQVVTFAPGETSKTVTVCVNGDAKVEADETFAVTLSNPLCNGTSTPTVLLDPAQSVGTGTIVNDDTAQNATIQLGPNGDTLRIVCRASDPATTAEVFVNGASTPTYLVPIGEITQLTIAGGAGDDQVIVDFANGSPLPSQGLTFDGGGAVAGDRLAWVTAAQAVRVSAEGITTGTSPRAVLRNVSFCSFYLQSPDARLTIDGATVKLPPNHVHAISANTALEVVNGGVLDLGGNNLSVRSVTVTGGTVLDGRLSAASHRVFGNANISAGLHGVGPLEKSGDGTAVLTGENDYGGGTVVSGGTLLIGAADAVPPGGALTIHAGTTVTFAPNLIFAAVGAPAAAGASSSLPSPVAAASPSSSVVTVTSLDAPRDTELTQATGDDASRRMDFQSVLRVPGGLEVHPSGMGAGTLRPATRPTAPARRPTSQVRAAAYDAALEALGRQAWLGDLGWLCELDSFGIKRRRERQPALTDSPESTSGFPA
jgi:autotransporter-associated beta strand protein